MAFATQDEVCAAVACLVLSRSKLVWVRLHELHAAGSTYHKPVLEKTLDCTSEKLLAEATHSFKVNSLIIIIFFLSGNNLNLEQW